MTTSVANSPEMNLTELIRLLHLVSYGTNKTAPDSYDFTCKPEQSYLFLLTQSGAVLLVPLRYK